jgi:hypothetical protein
MGLVRKRPGGGAFGVAAAALATLALVSCANGMVNGGVVDGGLETDAAAGDGSVVPSRDSGEDQSAPDTGGGCSVKIVINEVKTSGTAASDQMLELYNPNDCAVSLGRWALLYQSSAGNPASGISLHDFAAGDTIAARGFLTVASTAPMAKASGQVGLVDDTTTVVDAVAYGTITGGSYREGASAPSPPATGSIGRSPNGSDTDDNKTDFATFAAPTPGRAN